MSEPKFTPGPWKVDIGRGDWGIPITHCVYVGDSYWDRDNQIAELHSIQPYCAGASAKDIQQHVRARANACLIAAAPELYEALEKLEGWFDNDSKEGADKYLKEAKAARAKARGELMSPQEKEQ